MSLIVVNDADKNRIIKKISQKKGLFEHVIIGYQEFIKKNSFDFDEKTIHFIVTHYEVNYEIAEIYLKTIPYISENINTENEKINFIKELKQNCLDKKLLKQHLLFQKKIESEDITFYHLKPDSLLNQKSKQIHPTIIENTKTYPLPEFANQAKTMEEEVIFVCTEIRQLMEKGIAPNHIFLTNLNEEYQNLFLKYSQLFFIPMELKNNIKITSTNIVKTFLKNSENSIEKSLETLQFSIKTVEEQEILKTIEDINNKYSFIKNEQERQYFIKETLKKSVKSNQHLKNAVKEIDFYSEEIEESDYLFLLSMNEGIFPKIYHDEFFLTDEENKILGFDTTKEKNEKIKNFCFHKIETIKNLIITFKTKFEKIEYYPSSILEEKNIKIEKIANNDLIYSHEYNEIELAKMWDDYIKYGSIKPHFFDLIHTYPNHCYLNYKNEYQNIFENLLWKEEKIKLSYSSINSFFQCSFRYYLDNVLKIKKTEDTFSIRIGKIFHKILEVMYQSDFDFENIWKIETKEFILLDAKETFFLNQLKEECAFAVKTIKQREENLGFETILEKKITVSLDSEDFIFSGIIDKILWQEKDDKTLLSIIDYKTGNPTASLNSIFYGLNLQLPIYLFLIKELKLKNPFLLGIYYDKILFPIPESDQLHTLEQLKTKNMRLLGYSTNKMEYLSVFDPTFQDSKRIQGMKVSSKGFYKYTKVLEEEQIEEIIKITEEKIKNAAKSIKSGNFDINPKRISDKLVGCEYCNYQDICFKKEKDIINLKEQNFFEKRGGNINDFMDE